MSAGLVAMLAGLFAVPALLLWLGHRLRRRSARARGAFWGALVGHVVAIPPVLWVAMVPPSLWTPDDTVRGAIGFWALLVAPLVGGVVGAVRAAGPASPTASS